MKTCLIAILACYSTLLQATTFYVAPTGSDQNPGTIDAPWQTLAHACSQVKSGDTILVREGIYRGRQAIGAFPNAQPDSDQPITIRNYPGETPRFYGSLDFSAPAKWTLAAPSIWRTADNSVDGYDVGCVWHDDQPSQMKTSQDSLKQPWDFWFDTEHHCVLVYCSQNPAETAKAIEIPLSQRGQHTFALSNVHHLTLDGLAIKYTNLHGIAMSNVHHITIRNCTLSHGGGAWIWDNQPVRYGNGIELWCSGHDILVEKCQISHYFDTAITNQGNSGLQYNVTFRDNYIHHVKCGLEHWATESITVRDIVWERNLIEDTGDNWAGNLQNVWGAVRLMRLHPNGEGKDIPMTGTVENFVVRNNTIRRCGSQTGGMLEYVTPFLEHPSIRVIGGPYIVENNTITEGPAAGIFVSTGFSGAIRNNTISGCQWSGLHQENVDPKAKIENNTIQACGDWPIKQ